MIALFSVSLRAYHNYFTMFSIPGPTNRQKKFSVCVKPSVRFHLKSLDCKTGTFYRFSFNVFDDEWLKVPVSYILLTLLNKHLLWGCEKKNQEVNKLWNLPLKVTDARPPLMRSTRTAEARVWSILGRIFRQERRKSLEKISGFQLSVHSVDSSNQ